MRRFQISLVLALLSATLLFGGCSYLQTLQTPDDQAITSDIQGKLFADSVLKTRDIHVSSAGGVVTLTGTVSTDLEKAAVERMASQAKGVKQVQNQLTIGPASAEPLAAAQPEPTPPESARPERAKPARRSERASSSNRAAEPAQQAEAAPAPTTSAQPTPMAAAEPAPQPHVRQPAEVTIPAGSTITVRIIDGIDSAQSRPGQEFAASVDAPVVVEDHIVIRKGADARVRLVQAKSAGRMTGQSQLQVELVGLAIGAQTYAVESTAVEKAGASRGKRTAETIGGGAALGGLIGAIAGRGKGAAIGAAVGAGAGTAVQAGTKGQQIQIPPETKLDFTLKAPITVTM
ncbi:MAG: BON domain-containing protein [Acidobacteriia bacterium]|nr:BON domain-containing protein [Terriglobia bacterium]